MKSALFTLILSLPAGTAACNSASFEAPGSKSSGKSGGKSAKGDDDPTVDEGQAGGEPSGPSDEGSGEDQGGEGDPSAGDEASSCFAKKAEKYHFVLVFDASRSQLTSDPSNLRVSGAKGFVKRLGKLVDANEALSVKIATVSFAAEAAPGPSGWMTFKGSASVDDVQAEIEKVNETLALGTNYLAALTQAQSLLDDISASSKDKTTRTFVIFMTDGEPNRLGSGGIGGILGSLGPPDQALIDEIGAKVDSLVDATGAAVIAVATGTEIKDSGEAIVMGMAKPEKGDVNPKHVGIYKRVATADELKKLDVVLVDAVSECE